MDHKSKNSSDGFGLDCSFHFLQYFEHLFLHFDLFLVILKIIPILLYITLGID